MQRRTLIKAVSATALTSTLPQVAAATDTLPLSAPVYVGIAGLRTGDAEMLSAWCQAALTL